MRSCDRVRDLPNYALQIAQHCVVGKAKDSISLFLQKLLAHGVVLAPKVVDVAAHLNDKMAFKAGKVDNEAAQGMLTAKLGACHVAVAQTLPKSGLGLCRFVAHLLRIGPE